MIQSPLTQGNKMPVGATIVSVMVVIGFYGMLYLRFSHPEIKEDQNLTLMFGSMITAFGSVVQYWIGSSRSSATKDDAMQATAQKLADGATKTLTVNRAGKAAVRTVTTDPVTDSKKTGKAD